MRKAVLILMMVALFAASCYWPSTTITVSDDNSYLKIQYNGTVILDDNHTRIVRISPGGYFKCTSNNDELTVEADNNGNLKYQVNGDDMAALNATGKALMQQAANEIAKQQSKKRS